MKIFKGRFLTIPEMAVYRDRTILMPLCYMLQFDDFQGELAIYNVQEARGIIPMFAEDWSEFSSVCS